MSNGIPEDGGYIYSLNRGLEKKDTFELWQKKDGDPVEHPAHYCSHPSGIECIEITRYHDFCTGNALKYLWRCGIKGGPEKRIEDLRKAKKYIEFAIEDAAAGDM
jgi:hypothetical protein